MGRWAATPGAAHRITRVATYATGRLNHSSPHHVWFSGSDTNPASGYAASGAAEPATRATPSNHRGRHSLSGSTAAWCEGKVAGTR